MSQMHPWWSNHGLLVLIKLTGSKKYLQSEVSSIWRKKIALYVIPPKQARRLNTNPKSNLKGQGQIKPQLILISWGYYEKRVQDLYSFSLRRRRPGFYRLTSFPWCMTIFRAPLNSWQLQKTVFTYEVFWFTRRTYFSVPSVECIW